ncbi:MAG: LamG-like jellyroll fold domain-containing protein, partial [Nanoarchaeota archaeon]
DDAIVLWNATSINVTGNNIGIGGDDGLTMDGTNYSFIAFNNISETLGQNIDVIQSHNNNFTNNTLYYGTLDVLRIRHGSANNTFWNMTIYSNNSWFTINNSLVNNNFTNTTFANSNGSIRLSFFQANISQEVNTTTLNISNNRAYLNTTNLSNMNTSAFIVLNHTGTTFTNSVPGVDYGDTLSYAVCPADICTETSSTTDTLRFNISHWTSYRAQEAAVACGDTLTTSTTLTAGITGTGTCLTLGASNITLDCAGYTITYDSSGSGAAYGVLATFKNNLTVKNCIIQDASITGTDSANINFTTVNNSVISNNTLIMNSTATSYGIFVADYSVNNTIKNNTIISKTIGTPNGIRLTNAVTNTAINLTFITINTSTSVRGIWQDAFAENSTILNNTIFIDGRPSTGIDLVDSSRNNLAHNNVRANVSDSGSIIADIWYPAVTLSGDSHYNQIINNSLWASEISAYAYGIAISGPSKANNVTTNYVNPIGTGTGVYLYQTSNNTVRNNTINATFTGVDIFVYVALGGTNATGNVIDANFITANSIGIALAGAANNNITNNRVNASTGLSVGTGSGFNNFRNNSILNATTGIGLGSASSNNTFTNNNFSTTTSLSSHAINLNNANNTNFTNTILNAPSIWILLGENTFVNLTNITFAANNGTIRFPDQIHLNGTVNITQNKINITLNRTVVNSSNLTAFNRSASITLNSIVLTDPTPMVDYSSLDTYVACPADVCTETSYSGNVYTFNVSHWTSFAAQETPPIPETVSPSGTFVINATNQTRYGFNAGTFFATLFNFTAPIINITAGNNTGNFTSQIIDVGHAVTWKNVSWKSSPIGELPNFRNDSIQDAQQHYVNMSDLLLLMHFNNDAAFGESTSWAYDFSGRGHNGDITSVSPGGLFTSTTKLGNHSIFFTSSESDRVSINDTTSFGMIDHMTMSIWIRPTGLIDFERIWVKPHTSNDPPYSLWGLDLDNTAGARKVDFSISSGGVGATATSTTRVPVDTWMHVAGTYNGTTVVVYVNGKREAATAKTGVIDTNSQPVDIAYNRVFTSQHFQGFMDEAALWNRTLSDDEILRLYERGIHTLNLTGVRSCDDAACSGESMTEFNTTVSPQTLSIADNRYFQYQLQMGTENITYTPELYNFSIGTDEPAPTPNVTNVTLTKIDLSDPVTIGTLLNYTVTINNTGTDTAYNLTLTDTYDANVTFSLASPIPIGIGNNTFLIGNLTSGQVYTVNISVLVNSTVFNATLLNNTANISWINTTGIFNTKNTTINTTVTGDIQTDTCRILNTSGNYRVSQNLSMFGNFSTCFNITANDINLNCNGYWLRGNRSEGQHGINASALNNITIQNCMITNFTDGVVFSRVKNATLFNNTALNNSDDGFDIRSTNTSIISHNNASRNFDTNILLAAGWYNNFTNNT